MSKESGALDLISESNAPQPWSMPQYYSRTRSPNAAPLRRIFALFAFLQRRRIVFCGTLAIGLILTLALIKIVPKTYEATAHVLIVAANNGRDPSVASIDLPAVVTSTAVLSHVVDKLALPLGVHQLKHSIKANVKAKSSIMEIAYRDRVADRAVAVANAIAEELVTYYDSLSSSGADVTIRKLDRAILAVQERLRVIDDATVRQEKLHPFAQSDKSLDDVTTRLDDLVGQQRLANAALANDIAVRDAVAAEATLQTNVVRHEKLDNDPTYREMEAGVAKDEAELAFDRAKLTENNPELIVLEKKVAAERLEIDNRERRTLSSGQAVSGAETTAGIDLRKANAAVAGDQAKIAEINTLIADAHSRLHDTLGSGMSADRLKLQREAARADYLALTARRAAAVASRAESLSLGSIVVVDRAVRADAAVVGLGPGKLAIVLAILSLILAVAAAYVADILDRRLAGADQIERLYGVPLVALIDMGS